MTLQQPHETRADPAAPAFLLDRNNRRLVARRNGEILNGPSWHHEPSSSAAQSVRIAAEGDVYCRIRCHTAEGVASSRLGLRRYSCGLLVRPGNADALGGNPIPSHDNWGDIAELEKADPAERELGSCHFMLALLVAALRPSRRQASAAIAGRPG